MHILRVERSDVILEAFISIMPNVRLYVHGGRLQIAQTVK